VRVRDTPTNHGPGSRLDRAGPRRQMERTTVLAAESSSVLLAAITAEEGQPWARSATERRNSLTAGEARNALTTSCRKPDDSQLHHFLGSTASYPTSSERMDPFRSRDSQGSRRFSLRPEGWAMCNGSCCTDSRQEHGPLSLAGRPFSRSDGKSRSRSKKTSSTGGRAARAGPRA